MPARTVARLAEAINRGDLDAAVALYEKDAVMVAQPGQLARGTAEMRNALAGFIALKPALRMEAQRVVEAGDVALYLGRWSLRGTDPSGQPVAMSGESSDILRRQNDGRWLIALDNPWGTQILPPKP
ncbi:MAG TPA: SgcJ/EcaC family oxidoreductase [Burkholderiales bacterium]|nr:SgcJ/EcaC family oxidoreductase [Burkholderiales bacterium]